MNKTIENKFLTHYMRSGTVGHCIEYMRYQYDLGADKQAIEQSEEWSNFYATELPQQIIAEHQTYDNGGLYSLISPMMDEIEANLQECKTELDQQRYIYSLLTPFKEIVSVYNPKVKINQLEDSINSLIADKQSWESRVSTDERANLQIDAINTFIDDLQDQIAQLKHNSDEFYRLTKKIFDGAKWVKDGTVERCLSRYKADSNMFGIRLYTLLLTYGIDYMAIQKECGVYLINHITIDQITPYIGTHELAQQYLDRLNSRHGGNHQDSSDNIIDLQFDPINEIIIYQDIEKAKRIIKQVMKDLKNKEACIAIRALIMADIIKSDHTIARRKIFKIISNFMKTDIGADNSIGRHWNKAENDVKDKYNQIKKIL